MLQAEDQFRLPVVLPHVELTICNPVTTRGLCLPA